MTKEITSAQAMRHPTVVATINVLSETTQRLQDEIDELKAALAQPAQDDRGLQIAMRQWEDWKAYALELQGKLVKYEGGSPMILNAQPKRTWVGLTDDEIKAIIGPWGSTPVTGYTRQLFDKIEAKLKEKNFD